MKSIGIVRNVDELGRIVLPKELRKTLHIEKKDPLEIYTEGENIIMRKSEPACFFCGSADDIVNYMNKKICTECIEKLKNEA